MFRVKQHHNAKDNFTVNLYYIYEETFDLVKTINPK